MKIHELKILPQYYNDVKEGKKKFELRKDDRNYQEGDLVVLKEFDGTNYTGRSINFKPIKYVLRDCPEYGLKEGFCIIGF